MKNDTALVAAGLDKKDLFEIVDGLNNNQLKAVSKKFFDEELTDKKVIAEKLASEDTTVLAEVLEYLESASSGIDTQSSGLDVRTYVQPDYSHADVNSGIVTAEYSSNFEFIAATTWQYILPPEEVIIPQIDSPPQPDPGPEPRPTGTLSATFSYGGNQVELFSDYTARNLNEVQLFNVNGQLIQYSVTDVNVNLLSLGSWDNLKSIAFEGDAYDLQSKQLNFINFAEVDIDFFSYPPYAQLPKLAANVNIEGANRGDVTLTDQNDTLEISHTNLANGPVTNFEINTLDGDDYVLLKPSSFQYSYQGNVNDNSGSNIRATINTGDGNDIVDTVNSLSSNTINLGDGDDIANTGDGKDTILGGDGNDTIHAGGGNDTVEGGKGNDTLDGGAGVDTVRGGDGNDTLIVGAGDKLFGDGGNDTFKVGNNVLAGSYQGGSGNDTIRGDGHSINIRLTDKFTTANSIESIQGQSGNNYIVAGANKVNWDFTNTTIHSNIKSISGSDKNDKITGSKGNDTIFGHDGKDVINGGKGNDTLDGGAGVDTVRGGDGNDTLIVGAGDKLFGDGGNDTFKVGNNVLAGSYQGGSGNDTIRGDGHSINIRLTDKFTTANSIESIQGQSGNNYIVAGANKVNWDFTNTTIHSNIKSISGSDKNDKITGSKGNDTIFGHDGKDVINGGKGNDTLDGGAGVDTVRGGDGNDTLIVGAGDKLFGDGGNDTFKVGNNVLAGSYQGGSGNDTIRGDGHSINIRLTDKFTTANSIESIQGQSGNNHIVAGGNKVNWDFTNTTIHSNIKSISGSDKNDKITGSKGNDTIFGHDGKDVINGGKGNDTLDGGAGVDTVRGGDGNDTLIVGAGDKLFGDGGNDTFKVGNNVLAGSYQGGSGNDTIRGDGHSINIRLTDKFTTANSIESIQGQSGNNHIVAGANKVNWDFTNTTIHSNIKSINGSDKNDKITGSKGNDTIFGHDGKDVINGGKGNDTLDGGAGVDTVRGGDGNDTLIVGAGDKLFGDGGNDTFKVGNNVLAGSYQGGSGNDTIRGDGHSINIRLTDKFTTANSIESIQGQSGNNYIVAGANKVNWDFTNTTIHSNIKSINGSDKNDKITGSKGNDTIFGHDGKDVINGGKGNDTLDGGAGVDTVRGGDGNDTLIVGAGDKLFGDGGNDTFKVGNNVLAGSYQGGSGTDTIRGDGHSINIRLTDKFTTANSIESIQGQSGNNHIVAGANKVNWDFTNTTIHSNIKSISGSDKNDKITGSKGNDTIFGHDGKDVINGGKGNDTLDGGAGVDTVRGGDGNDTLIVGAGDKLFGDGGNDTFKVGNNVLAGSYQGGSGNDTIRGDGHSINIRLTDKFTTANSIESIQGQSGNNYIVAGANKVNWDFTNTTIHSNIKSISGSDKNDKITGSKGNDTIFGHDGKDVINGGKGNDTLDGGAGVDTVRSGDGNDTLIVGAGDKLFGDGGNDTFKVGNNVLAGSYQGGSGNDTIRGDGHSINIRLTDKFTTANSIESIQGQSGNNYIVAGANKVNWDFTNTTIHSNIKSINGSDKNDKITGSKGNDTIFGHDGKDVINGGKGNDTLDGGAGVDTVRGGDGNDTLIVGAGDKLFGDGGNDTFKVGNNVLAGSYQGGSGNDTIRGDGHSINIRLTDKFTTANSIESIQGQSGNNYIVAGGNKVNWDFSDTSIHSNIKSISGSDKNDSITGSKGNDTIFGKDGNDTIDGGKGNDQLTGGAGNDRIDGGAGTDTAHLSQDFNQYSFSYNALTQTLTMTNNVDGKDQYKNIEWFEFDDVTKSWSDIVNNIPPIVLDLDGDGVEYSDEMVAFDADGDGQNELMFWAGDDDGILTFDKDNNQEISDASEISFTQYLEGAKTDLEGLKAFDSDGNDIFDANDASWEQFGVTTNDEFYSLSELGIQSIELSSDNNAQQIKPGVVEYGQGVYHNEDGSSGVFADVAFDYQQVISDESDSMEQLFENLPEQEVVDQAKIANAETADAGAETVVAAPIEETLTVEIPPATTDV